MSLTATSHALEHAVDRGLPAGLGEVLVGEQQHRLREVLGGLGVVADELGAARLGEGEERLGQRRGLELAGHQQLEAHRHLLDLFGLDLVGSDAGLGHQPVEHVLLNRRRGGPHGHARERLHVRRSRLRRHDDAEAALALIGAEHDRGDLDALSARREVRGGDEVAHEAVDGTRSECDVTLLGGLEHDDLDLRDAFGARSSPCSRRPRAATSLQSPACRS